MAGNIKSTVSKRERGGRSSLNSDINITPFVDVMLVLLIIFMVTSPMLVTGVKLDLPEASEATPLKLQDEPLSIDIDAQGGIYIQEVPIELSELPMKLKAITKEKNDSKIVIRGDRVTNYGRIMEVIVEVNNAGFDKISLVNLSKIGKNTGK
ncbi:MAG: ExbD/TolR family protein [Alphaproteobacteria bacterium]